MRRILLIFILLFFVLCNISSIELVFNRIVNIDGGFSYSDDESVFIIESLYKNYRVEPEIIGYEKKEVLFRDDKRYGTKGFPSQFGESKIFIQGNLLFPEGEKLLKKEVSIINLFEKYGFYKNNEKIKVGESIVFKQNIDSENEIIVRQKYDGYSYSGFIELVTGTKVLNSFDFEGIVSCIGINGSSIYLGSVTWGNIGVTGELFIFRIK